MSMFTFKRSDPGTLSALKAEYRATVDAPLDGMWEAFTGMADHFSIIKNGTVIGYCAVNSEQKLLQFFVPGAANAPGAFQQAIDQLNITGAIVSTAEATFHSNCTGHQTSVTEHAIKYHVSDGTTCINARFPMDATFRPLGAPNLQPAVDFAVATLGADAGWLETYFGGLIERDELFGLFEENNLIATGECRPSHTQFGFADVGMIVGIDHRGKGIATNMLRQLIQESTVLGLKPICSTEQSNIPAQKAITNAGFTAYHRILEVTF